MHLFGNPSLTYTNAHIYIDEELLQITWKKKLISLYSNHHISFIYSKKSPE